MLNILVLSGGKGSRFNKILNHGCKALSRFKDKIWINITHSLFKNNFKFNFDLFLNINADHLVINDIKLINKNDINLIVENKREGVLNGIVYSSNFLKNNKYTLIILGDIIYDEQFVTFLNKVFLDEIVDVSNNDIIAIGRPERFSNDYEIFSKSKFRIDQDLQVGGAVICSTARLKKMKQSNDFISSFYEIIEQISAGDKIKVLNYTGLFEDFGTELRYKNIIKLLH